MKSYFLKFTSAIMLMAVLSGCGRDLSTSMYTSDTTLSLTMEGVIISGRAVKVQESDKLGNNTGGMLAGGLAGGAIGSGIGGGSGKSVAVVGGAILGGLAGAVLQQKLGESNGYEYIVKVDASQIKESYFEGNAAMRNVIATAKVNGLITVVQGTDNVLAVGQKVFIIFSDNRTRVIAAQ